MPTEFFMKFPSSRNQAPANLGARHASRRPRAGMGVRTDLSIRPRRRQMAWTAEDRRKYAPAIQEMVR